ncbi:hypothetical protein FDB54_03605 [Clostridium botulinum]|nr:hypothetical protein [Clostridium botulinum]
MVNNNKDMRRRKHEIEKEDQLQQQMKQRLENLPRFGYKTVRYFRDKATMQKAIDDLMNNNIMNLNSKTLTEDYIQEVYDMHVFTFKEGMYTLAATIVGGVLGMFISIFHSRNKISLPIFNSASAGGTGVNIILGFGVGAVLFAAFVGILMLYRPIKTVKPGYCMLTIYGSIEDKQNIENYLKKYDPIELQ